MIHQLSQPTRSELATLMAAQDVAQQRVQSFFRACILMLGLDPNDPTLKFDLAKGQLETPDPIVIVMPDPPVATPPASPAAPLPSDDAPPVPSGV